MNPLAGHTDEFYRLGTGASPQAEVNAITIEPNCWVVLRKVEFGNEQLATIWSSLPPSATFEVFASNPATAHLNRTTWPTLKAAEQAVLDAIAEAAPR